MNRTDPSPGEPGHRGPSHGEPAPDGPIPADLRARVKAWAAADPDSSDRAELLALLRDGSAASAAELADRFAARLQFGTAGLRGVVAAGPNRMNRAVVRGATAAVAGWLREQVPGAAEAGVVVGSDARHRSGQFADEAARVLAGAGIRVHMLPGRRPTPLLAFAVRHLSAAAGIMITASHNPPADNGYKLYLGDGAQIVPPADAGIEARIRGLGTLSDVPAAPLDSPLVLRHGEGVAAAYLDAVTAISPAPADIAGTLAAPLRVVYTPLHGVARDLAVEAIERAGFPARTSSRPRRNPTRTSRPSPFPTPSNRARSTWRCADARRTGAPRPRQRP